MGSPKKSECGLFRQDSSVFLAVLKTRKTKDRELLKLPSARVVFSHGASVGIKAIFAGIRVNEAVCRCRYMQVQAASVQEIEDIVGYH